MLLQEKSLTSNVGVLDAQWGRGEEMVAGRKSSGFKVGDQGHRPLIKVLQLHPASSIRPYLRLFCYRYLEDFLCIDICVCLH